MFFVKFIIAVIFVEATTEIVTKSEIFEPLRKYIYKLGSTNKFFNWLHRLLDCGYCFSVWVGLFFSIAFFRDLNIMNDFLDWFILGVVLHRLSNFLHNCMDRVHGI